MRPEALGICHICHMVNPVLASSSDGFPPAVSPARDAGAPLRGVVIMRPSPTTSDVERD